MKQLRKTHYIYNLLFALLVMSGCKKELTATLPDLSVLDYTVVEGTDASGNPMKEIAFHIQGNADIISFYSGEAGNNYTFKDGRVEDIFSAYMSFGSMMQSGAQQNQLSVLISSDFKGIYTADAIHEATWTDITDRFVLAQDNSTTPSNNVDIYEFLDVEKPLYIAVKYVTQAQNTHGSFSTWRFRDFVLTGYTDNGPLILATQVSAGWTFVNYGYFVNNDMAVFESGNIIKFQGNTTATNTYTESWAVSKALPSRKADLGPDWGVPIKSKVDPQLTTFKYFYDLPGEYDVAFVARNINEDDSKEVVRHLRVVVPEP